MADYIGAKATDAERMRELLRYANYAKVAEELGVHRATVARWAAGESVPSWAVRAVERLIVGERKETAPPDWAERLERKMDEIRANQDTIADQASRRIIEALAPPELLRAAALLRERQAELPRQGAGSPPSGASPLVPDRPEPQGQ